MKMTKSTKFRRKQFGLQTIQQFGETETTRTSIPESKDLGFVYLISSLLLLGKHTKNFPTSIEVSSRSSLLAEEIDGQEWSYTLDAQINYPNGKAWLSFHEYVHIGSYPQIKSLVLFQWDDKDLGIFRIWENLPINVSLLSFNLTNQETDNPISDFKYTEFKIEKGKTHRFTKIELPLQLRKMDIRYVDIDKLHHFLGKKLGSKDWVWILKKWRIRLNPTRPNYIFISSR